MKKVFGLLLFFLLFSLLYFRAENPRNHFSKYQVDLKKVKEMRNPANAEEVKKKRRKDETLQEETKKNSLKDKEALYQNKKRNFTQVSFRSLASQGLKETLFQMSNGNKYLLKPNIGLVKDIHRDSLREEEILDEKFGYLFTKELTDDHNYLGVVQNQDTGGLGILTGRVTVKLSVQEIDRLLDELGGTLEKEYSHLGIYEVSYNSLEELMKARRYFQENPSVVKRSTVEVLEVSRQEK